MALAQAGVERPKGRSAPNGDGIDDHANHIMADTAPVECTGPAGTVVLWHVMALHAAGINRTPGTIRKSVIYDFKLTAPAMEALQEARTARVAAGGGLGPEDEVGSLWAGWEIPVAAL